MTVNTMQFLRDQETARANRAAEELRQQELDHRISHDTATLAESERHNRTTEAETHLANYNRNLIDQGNLAISRKQLENATTEMEKRIEQIDQQIAKAVAETAAITDRNAREEALHETELEIKSLTAEKQELENLIHRADYGDVNAIWELAHGETPSGAEAIGNAGNLLDQIRQIGNPETGRGLLADFSSIMNMAGALLGPLGRTFKLFK